jgi:predicted AAA+ superfamily ATPase
VEGYIEGLIDAFICYRAKPIDLAGTRILSSPDKYYLVDPGLRRILLGSSRPDEGHILENIVYLELLRRNFQVSVGRVSGKEVDFVAKQGSTTTYLQVALTVRDPATLERELEPLRAIRDFNPRILLTLDSGQPGSHDGIQQVNAIDWLLGR